MLLQDLYLILVETFTETLKVGGVVTDISKQIKWLQGPGLGSPEPREKSGTCNSSMPEAETGGPSARWLSRIAIYWLVQGSVRDPATIKKKKWGNI